MKSKDRPISVKIKYDSWLPKLIRMAGITIGSTIHVIFTKEECPKELLKHELCHVYQIRNEGILKFYIKYLIGYLINLVKYRNHQKAYVNIKYERQAYNVMWFPLTENEKRLLNV